MDELGFIFSHRALLVGTLVVVTLAVGSFFAKGSQRRDVAWDESFEIMIRESAGMAYDHRRYE
jgi:hypothetical protein